MNKSILVGIALILAGGIVLVSGLSYSSQRSVVKLGGLQASVDERRPVPAWVAGLALVGGVALVAVGAQRRSGGGA